MYDELIDSFSIQFCYLSNTIHNGKYTTDAHTEPADLTLYELIPQEVIATVIKPIYFHSILGVWNNISAFIINLSTHLVLKVRVKTTTHSSEVRSNISND